MVRDEKKYQKARDFRKQGFSYSEIAKLVGVSTGTLSLWFSKQAFSKQVRKDNEIRTRRDNVKRIGLINKARKNEREKIYKLAIRQAEVEYKHYKSNPLFIAGLMLYVGEGDNKNSRLIRMANSRMDLHQIFIKFIIDFLGVERENIRFWLLLYPDLNETECKQVWIKKIKLPEAQFYKTQVIQGKSEKRLLQYGVGNTIIGSVVLKKKLMRWIELSAKELSK